MARLRFAFRLKLSFSEAVHRHAFTLRCVPSDSAVQTVFGASLRVMPECACTESTDHFGLKHSGTLTLPHTEFKAVAEGTVLTHAGVFEPAPPVWQLGPYRRFTPLTMPGDALKALAEELPERNVPEAVMRLLAERFEYIPGSTHAGTTAEQAAARMNGVCQDEAHIMLSLLRLRGIPCRYAMGYMLGEGSTHAWAEVLLGGNWVGMDPTNRRMVNEEYIRVAAGRDANDCSVNRGVFSGTASHRGESAVSVRRTEETQ